MGNNNILLGHTVILGEGAGGGGQEDNPSLPTKVANLGTGFGSSCVLTELQWATCVETLGSKTGFFSTLVTFPPLPPITMLIFLFLRLQRAQHLHNIELGGRGYQRIDARSKYNRTNA